MHSSPKGHKWVRRIKWLGLMTLLLLVLAAFLMGWYLLPLFTSDAANEIPLLAVSNIVHPPRDVSSYAVKHTALGWFQAIRPFNHPKRILILGFDHEVSRQTGRTDVIIVVEIHPKKGIGIISVPRDLWVAVPQALSVNGKTIQTTAKETSDASMMQHADTSLSIQNPEVSSSQTEKSPVHNRINSIYRLGNRYFGKGLGHLALKKVLRDELGLVVDYTVAVDYNGVKEIIDAMGGVAIDVDCPIHDNFISKTSATGYETLRVAAGRQRLSGREALLFMRSRHGRTDMDRSRRQQKVLLGVREQLLSSENFLLLPRYISRMMRHVQTDAEIQAIMRLAVSARDLRGNLHGMVLRSPAVSKMTTPDNKSVLVLNQSEFQKNYRSLFAAPLPGAKIHRVCPLADVALNWRELKQKHKKTSLSRELSEKAE